MRLLIFSLLLAVPLGSAAQTPGADASSATSQAAAPRQASVPSQAALMRTEFRVKYVNGANVYIDAGRDEGLEEGTKVVLKQEPARADDNDAAVQPGIVAKLTVVSVASSSAVCQVE